MAFPALQKSTSVRIIRRFFRVTEVVAPSVGARLATRMWFTLPPRTATATLPEGGTPFEVLSQRTVVRGHAWGDGPVVYLVHGWGGRGSQLAGFVDPLLRRGHRVVLFDAPSHGDSEPGPSGPRSGTGVEFGKALDAVGARFGPAQAVVAHSMGAVASLLTLRHGWLSADRLVFLAPMSSYATRFDAFEEYFGLGPRIRGRVDDAVEHRVGVAVEDFDAGVLAARVGSLPTLVVHDRTDREIPYDESVALVRSLPDARLVTTHGLGHRGLLRDPAVIDAVASFVDGAELVGELPATA
jgi:pimeloyl-ACP methyl ester carboxylesterase